ncbi:DUF6482 family protein [Stutzerimonas frequens]|uniref:DUF6482 family protein n=1 Tax=Stutzerimonas frequens TaxID=2968969 RepID=A0AA47E5P9_9GAMM|nr:DUF6482 family protein [Stutzerimonas frequens]WAE54634.1 DUF6482 family protein [Stutzerimonas frequens]
MQIGKSVKESAVKKLSRFGLRLALLRGKVARVELHGLRCCGYSAWVIDRQGQRRQFAEGERSVWPDQGSLKRVLRSVGVREVYWRQVVSHDEMIGRPGCSEPEAGLPVPLRAEG